MDERSIEPGAGPEKLSRQRRRALERKGRKQGSAAEKALASGAALALGVGLGLAPAADAATFTVTNLNDSGAGSLRDAIGQANAAAGADTINFQAGLTGTITLTSGQLSIIDSVDIQGPGAAALAVDGNNASRVFYLYNQPATIDVTISGLTIQNGNSFAGGGIADLGENLTLDQVTVQNSQAYLGGGVALAESEGGARGNLTLLSTTITGNQAFVGGGVYFSTNNAPTLIQDSVISDNEAIYVGGGIALYSPAYDVTIERSTISGNSASYRGGGIYLYDTDNGAGLTLRQSTLSGNSAGSGGGAYFYGPDGPVVVENSTISGNHATYGVGGGLSFYFPDTVTIRNSTIANNDAVSDGGGVYFYYSESTITVVNSIIAGNTVSGGGNPDLGGEGTFDVSYSLVQTPGTANINDNGGNLLGQDPLLGPLGNNGGPTQTQLPAGNSPVINAGDPAFTPPPSTDQRGFARVSGGRIDMGAVELNPGTIQFAVSAANVAEGAGTIMITVTRTGGADGAVSVSYATSDGTAIAPGDYASAAGTVNFADQDSAPKTFLVTIVNDTLQEPNETFNVTLTNPVGAALGATAVETVTILDDDVAPIPTLGDLGKALLAGLLAVGGLTLMRRRRGLAAPLVALSLTLGGVQAADARGTKDVKATALSQSQVAAAGVTLRFADGTTLTLPLGSVQIRDHRRHKKEKSPVRGLAGIPAGQPVVIKIKHAADGSVERVKILVFDTQQAAQAALERKGK
ncbi:MAG TPA: choice-of-anchor Q domain-containing protein [Thermoanaerobaculia bacterium]|nr:choice-of-anchor Q domain-containing protein [Thermoanaerobaculia bacterium]